MMERESLGINGASLTAELNAIEWCSNGKRAAGLGRLQGQLSRMSDMMASDRARPQARLSLLDYVYNSTGLLW